MKGILTFAGLIFSNFLFSQGYLHPTSTWKQYSVSCGGGNPYCSSVDYSITLTGDTMVGNIMYHKTLREGVVTTWDWTVDTLVEQYQISQPLNLIREENGKFYRKSTSNNNAEIIHDFNLTVGDTAIAPYCSTPQIVESIDTIYLGTIPRRKYTFENNIINYLIEGIGTSEGLFKMPCNAIGIEGGSLLQCYSQNGDYLELDTIDCDGITTTGLNKRENNSIAIEIYPNPTEDYIEIVLGKIKESHVIIRITDINGIDQIAPKIASDEIERIDLIHLPLGLYLVTIYDDDFGVIKAKKILKI